MICNSQPSEVEHLENLTVEGYYSTVDTWLRILDEKNEAIEKSANGSGGRVSKSMSGRRSSSST